jgi:putative addiction module component (TIGR02574 family)
MIQYSDKFPFHELTIDERIALAQDIWDSIADDQEYQRRIISPEVKKELDRRVAKHRAEPEASLDWEQVKAYAKAKVREHRASA